MDLDLTVYICGYDKSKPRHHEHSAFRYESDMAIKTCNLWKVHL